MNFMTQLGVLAIILIILVILIKSNQTLEQIYMEGESEKQVIEIPAFHMPKIKFSEKRIKPDGRKEKRVYEAEDTKSEKAVERSSDTIPVEKMEGWYMEIVDNMGRSYGRTQIEQYPFTIGRAADNDFVLDDLSVSGHHVLVEKEDEIVKLVDQGSLNKILAGGRPVTTINLTDRLEVCLGNTKLRFCIEEKNSAHTAAYQRYTPMKEWY